ncbi:MAG: methylated-DNA--[protein]-cysteine S-methyltransferase [Planctomycetota bacterium]|jgi:methylated-DNA-[protein]-cysteine S-methyltransferase
MPKAIEYVILRTRWGYFGLAGSNSAVLRTYLPMPSAGQIKSILLGGFPRARRNAELFKALQEQIIAYFEGGYVNFNKAIPIGLEGLSGFGRSVLAGCREVKFGETISYGQLAEKAGKSKAARAVGGVMARNPLPLIIPCHRVVRSDGKIGGFSAAGGVRLKKRMLEMERKGR